jgi:hypothetical protein
VRYLLKQDCEDEYRQAVSNILWRNERFRDMLKMTQMTHKCGDHESKLGDQKHGPKDVVDTINHIA